MSFDEYKMNLLKQFFITIFLRLRITVDYVLFFDMSIKACKLLIKVPSNHCA